MSTLVPPRRLIWRTLDKSESPSSERFNALQGTLSRPVRVVHVARQYASKDKLNEAA